MLPAGFRALAESCVLVTNIAICALGTLSIRPYVVVVMPLVRPEKYASAIGQKAPPLGICEWHGHHCSGAGALSAGSRLDVNNKTTIVKHKITAEPVSFISSSNRVTDLKTGTVKVCKAAPLDKTELEETVAFGQSSRWRW